MFSKRTHSFARAALHGLAVLGLVIAAAASASPAYAAPPPFDDFLTPVKITTATFSHSFTDINLATSNASDPLLSCESGGGTGDATVWYTFSPLKSGELRVATANSAYDTVVGIFMDDPLAPGTLLEMGCNNDVSPTLKTSSLTLPLRGGVKYYIEVARDSLSPAPTPPDALRLTYSFTTKIVAWGLPGGTKWNANAQIGSTPVFTYTTGWQDFLLFGAYLNDIRISNNVNNTATVYFDGEQIEIGYFLGPGMGNLEVIVDNVIVGTLAQAAAIYAPAPPWFSPLFTDGVHKLVLRHAAGPTKVNFDYLTVYPALDIIPPGDILDLVATTGTATGRVTLKWTSVGDDDMVGTAKSYEVRYLLFDGINTCSVDWPVGSPITLGLPAPKISGTLQSATLSGLSPGIHYLFCIAAIDEAGNMSVLPSNDADAIAFAGVPYGPGTYDDRNIGWLYTGNWKSVNDSNARNNTLRISMSIGDSARFYFTGNQFVFTYMAGPLGGLVDVYIDEVYYTTLDQFTPFRSVRYYTSPILPFSCAPCIPPLPGPHTVRFVHMTGVEMTVDQIYINTTYDLGSPDQILPLAAAPGLNDGEVDLTWTAVGDDPSLYGFPPGDDTAVKYEVRYSANGPIITETDWDYASPAGGVLTPPLPSGTPEAMTVTGLTPGVDYWFAVRVYDDAYYFTMSNSVNATAPYSGVWNLAGFYDDNGGDWLYSGMWSTQFTSYATNGNQHNGGLYAYSTFFYFNGTGFILTYQQGLAFGKLAVYVDGVYRGMINQYGNTMWQRQWDSLAYIGALPAVNHVVEFRRVGSKVNVDDIQILP